MENDVITIDITPEQPMVVPQEEAVEQPETPFELKLAQTFWHNTLFLLDQNGTINLGQIENIIGTLALNYFLFVKDNMDKDTATETAKKLSESILEAYQATVKLEEQEASGVEQKVLDLEE